MLMPDDLPIFDGHNDALQSIYLPKSGKARPFFKRNDQGHIDLPRMREGGYAGGFFAIFVPSNTFGDGFPGADPNSGKAAYDLPLPPAIDLAHAQRITIKGMASLFRLEAQSKGQIKVVRIKVPILVISITSVSGCVSVAPTALPRRSLTWMEITPWPPRLCTG